MKKAEILVLTSSIWLGDKTSVCTRVIVCLYSTSSDLNRHGQYAYSGGVGGCLITGNEDGAKHCSMIILYSLSHLVYVIPPQADLGLARYRRTGALLQPQYDLHDLEPDAHGAHDEGRRRHPGAWQPAFQMGCQLPLRLPES